MICASGTADPTGPTATDQPTGTAGPSVPTDTGNAGALQEPSPGTAGPTGPTVAVEQPAISASPAISADPAVPNWCGSGTTEATVAAGPAIAPQPGVSPVPSGSAIRRAFSAENLIIQPGVTTAAAIAEKQPTMSAVTTGPLHRPHREETGTPGIAAIAAGSAVTPQPSVATRTTNPARRVVSPSGGPALPAGPTVAVEPSTVAPGTPSSSGPATAPSPAIADQPRRAPGTPGHPRVGSRRPVSTVSVQQSARPTGLPRRCPVRAIADQRTPQQRLRGPIDQVEQTLLNVGGLGGPIAAPARAQRRHELVMKRGRLPTQRLIVVGMVGEQRRHRRGHLITGGGQYRGCRRRGSRVGRADRGPETRQIRCCH